MRKLAATGPSTELIYERPWLYPKQKTALFEPRDFEDNPARWSCIEASTKVGKTVGCIAWLFEQAMQGKPGDNYWWIAPIFGQALIAFNRMKRGLPREIVSSTGMTIKTIVGTNIEFKSGEKPDSLYGEDVRAAVMDEASRSREESWHALRTTLTATRGHGRLIGNVKGRKNFFYSLCRRAEAGERGMAYYKLIAADAVAAGVLSAEEIADAKSVLPDAVFRELYLAEPSDDGGNPFGIAAINACCVPSCRPPASGGLGLGLGQAHRLDRRDWAR